MAQDQPQNQPSDESRREPTTPEELPQPQAPATPPATRNSGANAAGRRGNGNGNGNGNGEQAAQQAEEDFGTRRPANVVVEATSPGPLSDEDYSAEMDKARSAAEERDKQAAIKRGASAEQVTDYESNVLWLMDNKVDDRVALHERDPRHPMGEVLFGAGVPRRAFLTPRVQELIQNGVLMPTPEPKRTIVIWDEDTMQQREVPNPKYPDQTVPDPGVATADQPGRPTRLGRDYIDPDYFEEDEHRMIRQRQAMLPTYVPLAPGGLVPPEVAKENEEFMARQRAMGKAQRR